MKSREEKILAMINFCTENPYKEDIRYMVKHFRIYPGEILILIRRLNLEVKGHWGKNMRREIQTTIENNPNLSVKQIIDRFGYKSYAVYEEGRKMGHRFENDYSIRLKRLSMARDYVSSQIF